MVDMKRLADPGIVHGTAIVMVRCAGMKCAKRDHCTDPDQPNQEKQQIHVVPAEITGIWGGGLRRDETIGAHSAVYR